MKLEVTQEHIDNGEKVNATKCVIALALLDAGFKTAAVFSTITVTNGAEQTVRSPADLFVFIRAFDHGRHLAPTVFDIPDLRAADAPTGAMASA